MVFEFLKRQCIKLTSLKKQRYLREKEIGVVVVITITFFSIGMSDLWVETQSVEWGHDEI